MRLRALNFGGIFDVEKKKKRLQELDLSSQNPDVWNNHKEMQNINQEKASLEKVVGSWAQLNQKIEDAQLLLEMTQEEGDEEGFNELKLEMDIITAHATSLETQSLLNGELDQNSSYMTINSGAGGTEACDWAGMLLRMFTRYSEKQQFKVELLELTEGEEAGIKSATLHIQGTYAYGLLKAETGVHRLVRISPFDSNARRHTSFAAVHVWPEIDDDIEIEVKDEDLRIDTYRSGGKGGQHVNKTDSAVRITHTPTGAVVQCQSQRSQLANREACMKMLKAALYELETEKRQKEKDQTEAGKRANEWGSQIRSYVLAPYQMVKDHRTHCESSNPDNVLDGSLDIFIEAFLKSKAQGDL